MGASTWRELKDKLDYCLTEIIPGFITSGSHQIQRLKLKSFDVHNQSRVSVFVSFGKQKLLGCTICADKLMGLTGECQKCHFQTGAYSGIYSILEKYQPVVESVHFDTLDNEEFYKFRDYLNRMGLLNLEAEGIWERVANIEANIKDGTYRKQRLLEKRNNKK